MRVCLLCEVFLLESVSIIFLNRRCVINRKSVLLWNPSIRIMLLVRCYSTFMISHEDAAIVFIIFRPISTKLIFRQHIHAQNFSFQSFFFAWEWTSVSNCRKHIRKAFHLSIETDFTRGAQGKWIRVALKQLSRRKKKTSTALVRKRSTTTERPPLVGEDSANFSR
jgi:hypothetical protein